MRSLLQSTAAYRTLAAESAEKRLNHAYLLVFNDARNLRAALRIFAEPFFLPSQEKSADKQRISELIGGDLFSDCIVLPEQGKKFSVVDAETIREESALKPVEGDKKVFLIADFAEATAQAQNKLLKLLEEPPAGVYFLLGATADFSVLPTVLSRCEKLEIPPFSMDSIAEFLSRNYPARGDGALCAAACGGSVGEAQNILEGGYYSALLSDAFALTSTDPFRLPALVKRVGETKYKKELIALLRMIFRDALILKTAGINGAFSSPTLKNRAQKHLLLPSEREKVLPVSEFYSLPALVYAQETLAGAEKDIRFNGVFAQTLELCMARIFERNTK